jgi:hypothetical protein
MTAPNVSNVVVSRVWTQVLPGLFDDGGDTGSLGPLVRRPTYVPAFDRPGGSPKGLDARFTFPWARDVGQHFWMKYLGAAQTLAELPGQIAWSSLVPARERLEAVKDNDSDALFIPEAFYYPFGIGLMFTVRLRSSMDLGAAVDRLDGLMNSSSHGVKIDGAELTGHFADLAPAVFHSLQPSRFSDGGHVAQPLDAFTVSTIVQGDDDAASQDPLDPKGPILRALYRLATWSPAWQYEDPLADKANCVLKRRSKPPNHVTFVADRGRAVWFPVLFKPFVRERHSLSCYHRNLALASLTADVLTSLIRHADQLLGPAGVLSSLRPDHQECVRNGAQRLRELYLGDSTYRSRSIRRQIDANGGRDAFNRLAKRLQQPELKQEDESQVPT